MNNFIINSKFQSLKISIGMQFLILILKGKFLVEGQRNAIKLFDLKILR